MGLSLPVFQMFLRWDERPLKSNHLKRFSLVLQGPAKEELEVRGFLANKETGEIMPPITMVGNSPYEIVQLSPSLKGELLRSFHHQQMLGQLPVEKVEIVPTGKESPDGT